MKAELLTRTFASAFNANNFAVVFLLIFLLFFLMIVIPDVGGQYLFSMCVTFKTHLKTVLDTILVKL